MVAWLCLSVLFWGGVPAWAQVVGKVTNIAQGATVTQLKVTKKLALKSNISTGDLLKTDATGQLQIAFVDRTRIVVGPSSELLIEDVTLSGGKRLPRLSKTPARTARFHRTEYGQHAPRARRRLYPAAGNPAIHYALFCRAGNRRRSVAPLLLTV